MTSAVTSRISAKRSGSKPMPVLRIMLKNPLPGSLAKIDLPLQTPDTSS